MVAVGGCWSLVVVVVVDIILIAIVVMVLLMRGGGGNDRGCDCGRIRRRGQGCESYLWS